MSPYEMFRVTFFDYIGRYGGFVGVNMVDPNFRVSRTTIFWLFVNVFFFIAAMYTVCAYPVEILEKLSTYFGLIIQVRLLQNVSKYPFQLSIQVLGFLILNRYF